MQQMQRTARPQQPAASFEQSPILSEGLLKLRDLPVYKRPLYFTLDSIPVKYAFPIAWELAKVLRQTGFSRTRKADCLDLRPNYAGLHFTPLEMSFARRPEGTLNFLKDIITLRPYRLLSEVRDGYLYSPDGGALHTIFPKTIKAMLDDPFTLAILKSDRLQHLARCAMEYDAISKMETMADREVFSALVRMGRQNTKLFYMFGFRDSLVKAADVLLESALGSGWAAGAHQLAKRDGMPKRGPDGMGKSEPDSAYVDATYELRELSGILGEDCRDRYERLKREHAGLIDKLERIFRIREELVQESVLTLGTIEYCRGVLYEAANELGMRYQRRSGQEEGSDMLFLSIYEVSDLMKGKGIDAHAASRRKQKWDAHNRPRE